MLSKESAKPHVVAVSLHMRDGRNESTFVITIEEFSNYHPANPERTAFRSYGKKYAIKIWSTRRAMMNEIARQKEGPSSDLDWQLFTEDHQL